MSTTEAEQKNWQATNWGRWGDDDERGALNLMTPEAVQQAAASITTGKVYSLGIPIQSQGVPLMDYRGTPMRLTLQNELDEGMYADFGCLPGTGAHEDILVFASHTTSHMDALCHVYGESRHYNNFEAGVMKTQTGAQHLGIEKVRAIAGRAVLFDMVKHFGDEKWVELGRNITADDLQDCASAQGTELRPGDIALIRTGYLDMWFENYPGDMPFAQAGIGFSAAEWLVSQDVVAVGADNAAVEVVPFDRNDFLGIHKVLLVGAGVYMLEFLNFSEMAADECYEGFMCVSPLVIPGATGCPINPTVIG